MGIFVGAPGKPETAEYHCEGCEQAIAEHHKTAMLQAGEWRPTAEAADPNTVGYHLSALYSPIGWLSWTRNQKFLCQSLRRVIWAILRCRLKSGLQSLRGCYMGCTYGLGIICRRTKLVGFRGLSMFDRLSWGCQYPPGTLRSKGTCADNVNL